MERLKHRWKNVPQAVRKPLIFIVGSSVIVTGLLMLVLPGPGWAAIFLGFAILATEFAVAEKVRDWMVSQLKRLFRGGKKALKTLWRRTSTKL